MSNGNAGMTRRPKLISDWSLEAAIGLDRHHPSFLSFVCCASDVRRQAIFAALAELNRIGPQALVTRFVLSQVDLTSDEIPETAIARALMAPRRSSEVLKTLHGTIPAGFLGALKRLGPDPLPEPALYRLLYDLFSRPEHRQRAKVLGQISGQITANQIRVLNRLDAVLVHPKILRRTYQVNAAEDANAALALIRATVSTVTDAALRQSIEAMRPKADLGDLFGGWLEKMDRPVFPPPIPLDDPDLELIASGDALRRMGRLYRNCLAQRVAAVAANTQTFLAWRHGPVAIAELRRLSTGGYVLVQVHGNRNRSLDPSVARAIREKLESYGIPAFAPGEGCSRVRGVLHMVGMWDIPGAVGFEEDEAPAEAGQPEDELV